MGLIRPLKKPEVKKKHREVEPSDDGGPASNQSALTGRLEQSVFSGLNGYLATRKPFSPDINNLVTELGF